MQELLRVLRDAVKKLDSAGVESAEYDARLLLAHACGVSLAELNKALILGDLTDFSQDYASKYSDFVSRRASREPLQHIVGRAPFRYLDLQVGKGVFVPRPETEIVVEAGLDWLRESGISKPTVVDLCAGSGAIGLSIAAEVADAQVWAVEKSPEAFQYLQKNFEEAAKKVGKYSDFQSLSCCACRRNQIAYFGLHAGTSRNLRQSRFSNNESALRAGKSSARTS